MAEVVESLAKIRLLCRIFMKNVWFALQTDYSRVNEFGVSGDMLDGTENKSEGATPSGNNELEDKSNQSNGSTQPEKSDEAKKTD